MNKKIIWQALVNAAATFVYTSVVAWFMFNANSIFGKADKSFVAPLFMLLLFIVSASITGFFVLGKPIQSYLENHKKEAVYLLFTTLGWLVIFVLITMSALLK